MESAGPTRTSSWKRRRAEPCETAAAASEVALCSCSLCAALPFVLSAKSESALAAQARRLAAHLEARPELRWQTCAFAGDDAHAF